MQLPNDSSDSGDPVHNSAEFSAAHTLALNLEAVFNLTMNNALGRGREWGGQDERGCGGRGGKVRERNTAR